MSYPNCTEVSQGIVDEIEHGLEDGEDLLQGSEVVEEIDGGQTDTHSYDEFVLRKQDTGQHLCEAI